MNLLVSGAMLLTLISIAIEIAVSPVLDWRDIVSLALTASAVGLALAGTVRDAVAIGARAGSLEHRSMLARRVYRDHLFCLAAIGSVIVLQLTVR
jgi:hypothetical protein